MWYEMGPQTKTVHMQILGYDKKKKVGGGECNAWNKMVKRNRSVRKNFGLEVEEQEQE